MAFAANPGNNTLSDAQATEPVASGMNGHSANGLAELSSLFDLLDLEGNGDLDLAEFKVGLSSIGGVFSHSEATLMFEAMDTENEQYINRESFMEWLSAEAASAELAAIRSKLIAVLSGESTTKQNPLQDLQDEDDIVEILGANQQYIDELDLIRSRSRSRSRSGSPSRSRSDSEETTKIKGSESGDGANGDGDGHGDVEDEDSESDSMDSAERREIIRRKEASFGVVVSGGGVDGGGPSQSEQSEASLMEQQMAKMVEQEKWVLDRKVSGRQTFKMEDADKWKAEELQNEMDAMEAMHRRLSSGSLSIVEIQHEAEQQMAAFRKLTAPQRASEHHGPSHLAKGTMSVTVPSRIPSKADDDFGLLLDVKPTIADKTMPPKAPSSSSSVSAAAAADHELNDQDNDSGHGHGHGHGHGMAMGMHPISPHDASASISMVMSPPTAHSAASSGSFGMSGHGPGSRRSSYSHDGSRSESASRSMSMRMSGADISQYTASGGGGGGELHSMSSALRRAGRHGPANPALRLWRWYLGPLRRRESVLRLWFHGVNAALSVTAFVVMAALTALAVALTPFCGLGLLFLYFDCVAARRLVAVDARCCHYLFALSHRAPVLFALSPSSSHSEGLMAELKLFCSDPQTVSMVAYFLVLKLPAAALLSGSSLVMFSGVCSILMAPMVYWLQPDYFEQDRYCLFGVTSYDTASAVYHCSGWSISSFGETFVAALVFAPALPLTLHLCNATAKLLHSFTANALSIHSQPDALSQPLHHQSATQSPHQPMVYGNMNMNAGNAPYR